MTWDEEVYDIVGTGCMIQKYSCSVYVCVFLCVLCVCFVCVCVCMCVCVGQGCRLSILCKPYMLQVKNNENCPFHVSWTGMLKKKNPKNKELQTLSHTWLYIFILRYTIDLL